MTALDAAFDYVRRGWPVSPWSQRGNDKFPLSDHGHLDATVDEAQIGDWWSRWPNAIPSVATGERSGLVALDIDVRPTGSGFDTLEFELDISTHPVGPTAHSPRGGCAILFRWPGHYVETTTGKLAAHLDIKADKGSLLLPPGPKRWWDPHLGPSTPIDPMPDWMHLPSGTEPPPDASPPPPPLRPQPLIRYAEIALDGAVKAITNAPDGQQHHTLNKEVYSIARLVAGGVIPAGLAIEALTWAARQLRTFDPRRPWRAAETEKMVRGAFADGLARPRQPEARR
jgi:hypothetical protein